MVELADNIEFAIENDIGLNLSPVVIYPVTEQLNVFSDFANQTKGWKLAITKAKELVASAKLRQRPAIARVDPEGMLLEIESLFEAASVDYFDTTTVVCEIDDRHGSLKKMSRPGIIAHIRGVARAYAMLTSGMNEAVLQLPRNCLRDKKIVRFDFVHDAMEPGSSLVSGSFKVDEKLGLHLNYRVPEFNEVKRPRNINWANYGDSTPDGHHVIHPVEIFEIYRKLYEHELKSGEVFAAGDRRRLVGAIKQFARYVRG
jgi:hypothetical protein